MVQNEHAPVELTQISMGPSPTDQKCGRHGSKTVRWGARLVSNSREFPVKDSEHSHVRRIFKGTPRLVTRPEPHGRWVLVVPQARKGSVCQCRQQANPTNLLASDFFSRTHTCLMENRRPGGLNSAMPSSSAATSFLLTNGPVAFDQAVIMAILNCVILGLKHNCCHPREPACRVALGSLVGFPTRQSAHGARSTEECGATPAVLPSAGRRRFEWQLRLASGTGIIGARSAAKSCVGRPAWTAPGGGASASLGVCEAGRMLQTVGGKLAPVCSSFGVIAQCSALDALQPQAQAPAASASRGIKARITARQPTSEKCQKKRKLSRWWLTPVQCLG